LDPTYSTLIYLAPGVGYICGTPLSYFIRKTECLSRRFSLYISFCILSLSMGVVTGDFGVKPKLYISIFGQVCGGISLAIMNCT
jgi:hypothetical protein